jgi:hypothetical protein
MSRKPSNTEVATSGIQTRAAEVTQRIVRPVIDEVCQGYIADLRNEIKTMTTSKGIKPQLEAFKGNIGEDAEIWVTRFEQYAKVCKWENQEPVQWFPFFLQEAARSWYHALPIDTAGGTWEILKTAFKKRFQPHGAIKWARLDEFQMRKQGPEESVDVFVEDISRMGRQLDRSADQIKESVIRGLRTTIRNVILQKDYAGKNLDVIVEWAKQTEILNKADQDSTNTTTLQAITAMYTKMEEWRNEIKTSVEQISKENELNQVKLQQKLQQWPNNNQNHRMENPGYPIQGRTSNNNTTQQQERYQNNPRHDQQQERYQNNPRHDQRANSNPETQCRKCGKYFTGHFSNHQCPAKNRTCDFCNKVGHYQSMCYSKKYAPQNYSQQ